MRRNIVKLVKKPFLFGSLVMFGLFLGSCNDSTVIGGVIPGIEPITGTLKEDFNITTTTVERESIKFSIAHKLIYNICGNIEDPIFGSEKASFYTQSNTIGIEPAGLDSMVLDSVVLIMSYDTTLVIGDTSIMQNFIVEELDEVFDPYVEYNSEQDFLVKSTILGTKSFLPTPNSFTLVRDRDSTDVYYDTLAPQLRIRLDDVFGQRLLDMDSLAFIETDELQEVFKGIKVSSDVENASMLSFNLAATASRVRVYYSSGDTIKRTFSLPFTGSAFKVQNYDLSSSVALQDFVDNPEMGDSLTFSEGMSGVSTMVTFNDIESLVGNTINKAELYVTEFESLDNDPNFKHFNYLACTQRIVEGNETNFYYVDDLQTALLSAGLNYYGGKAELTDVDGEMRYIYKVNITSYIQNMVDGNLEENTLFLEPFDLKGSLLGKNQVPFRSAFYGSKNSEFPLKLRVLYTPNN